MFNNPTSNNREFKEKKKFANTPFNDYDSFFNTIYQYSCFTTINPIVVSLFLIQKTICLRDKVIEFFLLLQHDIHEDYPFVFNFLRPSNGTGVNIPRFNNLFLIFSKSHFFLFSTSSINYIGDCSCSVIKINTKYFRYFLNMQAIESMHIFAKNFPTSIVIAVRNEINETAHRNILFVRYTFFLFI